MSRRPDTVYECPDCKGQTREVYLTCVGGKVRHDFSARDGGNYPRAKIVRVLCWWCRTFHAPEEVETCMKIPDRQATTANGTPSQSSALAAGLLTQYSELWAFLTGTSPVGGPGRAPGKLSLSCESDLLAVNLNDCETGQYCFLQGRDLDELLLTVESGLGDGTLPWRASKFQQPKPRKKAVDKR